MKNIDFENKEVQEIILDAIEDTRIIDRNDDRDIYKYSSFIDICNKMFDKLEKVK